MNYGGDCWPALNQEDHQYKECPEPHPHYDLRKGSIFISWDGVVDIQGERYWKKRQSPAF